MKTPMRYTSAQEMVEALFAVLFASIVLSAAASVFYTGGGGGVKGGEEAHDLLKSLLNWEVWLEDGAINVDVASAITYSEIKDGVGVEGDFQVRIYSAENGGMVLLYSAGSPGDGGNIQQSPEATVLSSPTPILVGGVRLPGMLEVVI